MSRRAGAGGSIAWPKKLARYIYRTFSYCSRFRFNSIFDIFIISWWVHYSPLNTITITYLDYDTLVVFFYACEYRTQQGWEIFQSKLVSHCCWIDQMAARIEAVASIEFYVLLSRLSSTLRVQDWNVTQRYSCERFSSYWSWFGNITSLQQ